MLKGDGRCFDSILMRLVFYGPRQYQGVRIKGEMRQRGGYTPGQPSLLLSSFWIRGGGCSHYLGYGS